MQLEEEAATLAGLLASVQEAAQAERLLPIVHEATVRCREELRAAGGGIAVDSDAAWEGMRAEARMADTHEEDREAEEEEPSPEQQVVKRSRITLPPPASDALPRAPAVHAGGPITLPPPFGDDEGG